MACIALRLRYQWSQIHVSNYCVAAQWEHYLQNLIKYLILNTENVGDSYFHLGKVTDEIPLESIKLRGDEINSGTQF